MDKIFSKLIGYMIGWVIMVTLGTYVGMTMLGLLGVTF